MNTKRILIAILLLVGLTLSGCFLPPPPPGVGYDRGYGHGYYGHSRSHGHGNWDRDYRGSGRDYRYWR